VIGKVTLDIQSCAVVDIFDHFLEVQGGPKMSQLVFVRTSANLYQIW